MPSVPDTEDFLLSSWCYFIIETIRKNKKYIGLKWKKTESI